MLFVLCSLFSVLLSGCLLVSGERSSSDSQPAGGNFTTSFVGADGQDERTIDTGAAGATLRVFVIVKVERGELRVEMLNPDGAVVFSTQARPDQSTTRTGSVVTDDQGQLRYRVTTRGARNGSYQVLYQRTGQ